MPADSALPVAAKVSNDMQSFILASKSKRRRSLLDMLGVRYDVIVTDANEDTKALSPADIVMEISKRKAEAVKISIGDRIIIAADTIVWHSGCAIGKPCDIDEAKRILRGLSGDMHEVYSGVTLIGLGKQVSFYERTSVYFRKLSEREICRYAESGSVLDKAGAYGIQDPGGLFVEKIEGDFYNVVGLPLTKMAKKLHEIFGVDLL